MNNTGRIAPVTGGNQDHGEAIARALNDAGHAVIVTHTPGNREVAAWLRTQTGGGTHLSSTCGRVRLGLTQALASCIHANGRYVDIRVNNAGITRELDDAQAPEDGVGCCAPTWARCST